MSFMYMSHYSINYSLEKERFHMTLCISVKNEIHAMIQQLVKTPLSAITWRNLCMTLSVSYITVEEFWQTRLYSFA